METKRFNDQLYLPWLALFHCYPPMDTVVLYPSPGMGHLVSMVELGKLLLLQHPSVSVTILTTPFPFDTSAVSMFIAGVTSAIPSISFHSLPPVSLSQELSSYFNMEQITFDILRLNDSNVRDVLASLSIKHIFPPVQFLWLPSFAPTWIFAKGKSCCQRRLQTSLSSHSRTKDPSKCLLDQVNLHPSYPISMMSQIS
ncbi:hypothetical protein Droror1_Dr00003971 [Drosera rotundifolia]